MNTLLAKLLFMLAACIVTLPTALAVKAAQAQSNLDACPQGETDAWDNCHGTWSDGQGYTYEGEWHDNKENGQGIATYPDGDRYEGEFRDGSKTGRGTWWSSDGDKYVGDFRNDLFEGEGTYTFASGDQFSGVFKTGEPDGYGTYAWADGSKSVGEFHGFKLNGEGANYASDGSLLEQGLFEDDVLKTPGHATKPENPASDLAAAAPSPDSPEQTDMGVDQQKVALVIGNGAYENAPPLANPSNDARAMSTLLAGLGFKVITTVDANKRQMENAIRQFLKEASGADLSLFFYSGHGIEVGGENFLIPVDTRLEDEAALNFEVINSKIVTNAMGGEKQVGIILLDACRSNPFTRSLKRSMAATRAATVSDGLAPISADGGGLVVAFATSPGDTASDGTGMNSPFTTALLKWLPEKGLEIEQVMKRVKSDVSKLTGNDQRPWTNSDLTLDIYVAGK